MSLPPTPLSSPAGQRWATLAHLAWEAVLLLLLLVATVVVTIGGDLFGGPGLWFNFAVVGLLASGFALSLRTATPNLAVGALAALAAATYARLVENDWPGLLAGAVAILLSLVIGLFLGLLAGLTSAPAWAVTLGGMAIAQSAAFGLTGGLLIRAGDGPAGTPTAVFWTLLFIVGSLAGGLLWQVPGLRTALSANRAGPDPVRFQSARLVGALVGVGGSSLLAGMAGLVMVSSLGAASPADPGHLLIAVGAALLGGVSVFGARGGYAGTVLAVALLVVINRGLYQTDAPHWAVYGLPAALAILAGIGISRLMEAVSGPLPGGPTPVGAALPTPTQPLTGVTTGQPR